MVMGRPPKDWEGMLGFEKDPVPEPVLSLPETEPPVPPEEYADGAFNAMQVQEMAKASLDFLAALALPLVFKFLFPDIFKQIWQWLTDTTHKVRDFSQLAIGLPRGFGKTMLIKIFVLYVIIFTKKQFILIICGTQTKANNVVSDITSMLQERNIKSVFGDWQVGLIKDTEGLKRFGYRGRNVILMGAGAGSDIRGITLENERPDLMIFDDIQTRDEADSEVVSSNLETWMYGTAMKAKSPKGCMFIFIANMYPTKHSLLRKIKANPNWTKFIVGGILQDGTSLWEELQPVEQLLREFQNDLASGHPEVFYAEVLNDENASVNKFIDVSQIPQDPSEANKYHAGNYVIIDVATDKSNADAVTIAYFEVHDTFPVAKEIIEARLSPGDMIVEALKLCLKYGCRLIAVESNAYQYSALYWFNYMIQQYGLLQAGINCVDVYSGSTNKNARILSMFKQLLKGELFLGTKARASVTAQIISFNPLKNNNTDGILDCLTYAHKVLELYGEFIVSNLTLQLQESSSIPVRSELENSPF
jgi:hypothetical protein